MKRVALFERISNWFKRVFSRNNQNSEETFDETLRIAVKKQHEVQKIIDEQKRQQAESNKKISDFTNQLLKKNQELINEANNK